MSQWTTEEMQVLTENAGVLPAYEIAERVGRSENAVRLQASAWNLSLETDQPPRQGLSDAELIEKNKRKSDITTLRARGLSWREIGEQVGLSGERCRQLYIEVVDEFRASHDEIRDRVLLESHQRNEELVKAWWDKAVVEKSKEAADVYMKADQQLRGMWAADKQKAQEHHHTHEITLSAEERQARIIELAEILREHGREVPALPDVIDGELVSSRVSTPDPA